MAFNSIFFSHIAAQDSRLVCERQHGFAPEILIDCPKHFTFTYVPSHLHYILTELFKNSLRATIIQHQHNVDGKLPKVKCVIVQGKNDITVKVSDKGGGIPFEKTQNGWTYVYTSTNSRPMDEKNELDFHDASLKQIKSNLNALSGYGCGLPLSRLYAQYFGGGLELMSMEGYGTDAYCYLNRLGKNCEDLPRAVIRSAAERDSSFREGEEMKSKLIRK